MFVSNFVECGSLLCAIHTTIILNIWTYYQCHYHDHFCHAPGGAGKGGWGKLGDEIELPWVRKSLKQE